MNPMPKPSTPDPKTTESKDALDELKVRGWLGAHDG